MPDFTPQFNAGLPKPPYTNYREAARGAYGEEAGLVYYEAPGTPKKKCSFLFDHFEFTFGQTRDAAEYPCGGLWSGEWLNEKTQQITVMGYIRGEHYIAQRQAAIEALRVKTDDKTPGFLDLPLWGRFPVVVGENCAVSETMKEGGQCSISLPFTRAAVTADQRADRALTFECRSKVQSGAAACRAAALDAAEAAGNVFSGSSALTQGFTKIKTSLLAVTGAVQRKAAELNALTSEVSAIGNLLAQAVTSPRTLALAAFNAAASIAGTVLSVKDAAASAMGDGGGSSSGDSSAALDCPEPEGAGGDLVLALFLDAASFDSGLPAASETEKAAKAALEQVYRLAAFAAAAELIAGLAENFTREETASKWRLFRKLEDSLDLSCPALYAAVSALRVSLHNYLASLDLGAAQTRRLPGPYPLLRLARTLSCGEDTLRALNAVGDSFNISGKVCYV